MRSALRWLGCQALRTRRTPPRPSWRRRRSPPRRTGTTTGASTAPQTLNLSATDDVAVAKFQYSLDGGATYIDVPVTAGPSATAAVPLSQEGNTTVRYRAVDSAGNVSRGATDEHDPEPRRRRPARPAVRLASTTGRGPGDSSLIDTGAGQETATIATIVTPGSRRARAERDADGAAGQRARRERRGGRHASSTPRSRC